MLLRQGNATQALAVLQDAQRLLSELKSPYEPMARALLSRAFLALGKVDEAEVALGEYEPPADSPLHVLTVWTLSRGLVRGTRTGTLRRELEGALMTTPDPTLNAETLIDAIDAIRLAWAEWYVRE